ncbi:ABC transporter substrate-binding protein [Advenella kashmirensis WT001]|uniref:ABC transporter substrate-binding protein n=1 Tax=Advenella kashmirensis (strain DSM 17095 / LMG 22695 / WT001) TaxID=1036672 RepID=I3U953_ADVKW|nr:tripartite tricarboxylate transporter substrate binding protein [Advenella kashmirensis]AFK61541.1 ABC transporter substrate-binding protein [Advenella kashmirensis WT001]
MNKYVLGLAAGLSFVAMSCAQAQYPEKPVSIIVPFPAGQTGDLIARTVGEKLSKALGQAFIVENRGGAGGTIGTGYAARAKQDGYTLLLTSTGPFSIAPHLYKSLSYDPLKDLQPIAEIATSPQVLAVNPDNGINSLKDLVAKAKQEDLNFASAGTGSTQHLTMEYFLSTAGAKMTHVPFKGSSEAQPQVISGLISGLSDTLPAILPQIKAGRLKALAVVGSERSAFLPDTPSTDQAGFPGLNTVAFFALMAPKGTPPEVIELLNAQVNKALKEPATLEQFKKLALTPAKEQTAAQFTAYLEDEAQKWKKITDTAKVEKK